MPKGITNREKPCRKCGEPLAVPRPSGASLHPDCSVEDPLRHRRWSGYLGIGKSLTYAKRDCEICGLPLAVPRPKAQKYHEACKQIASKRVAKRCYQRIMGSDAGRERNSEYRKKKYKELRGLVLSHYGPFCACCGESGKEFLTLDHVNNDGAKHRRELGIKAGSEFYKWVIRNGFPDSIQVLCASCNLAKGIYGICPHQKEREERKCLTPNPSSFAQRWPGFDLTKRMKDRRPSFLK